MKLLKTEVKELVRNLKGDGLFTTTIEYKTTEAKGELNYTGPRIPPLVWHQILSFFKWSYESTKGESQVRLFVSPKHGTWKAWAFPQQASCGMSTKELNTEDSQKQRAELFTDQDAWTAWGTVHHHCDMGAFQSSVDETDEKNVGGLHITVGDMAKPHHSLHARFYHQGDLYEPDMSLFWDIGNLIEKLPLELKAVLQSNAGDKIAREQMCIPSEVEFPKQWKDNLIEVRTYGSSWSSQEKDGDYKWIGQERYQRQNGVWVKAPWEHSSTVVKDKDKKSEERRRGYKGENLFPIETRIKEAMDELEEVLLYMGVATEIEVLEEIESFIEEPTHVAISRICKQFHLTPADLLDAAETRYKEAVAKEVDENIKADEKTGQNGETGAGYGEV